MSKSLVKIISILLIISLSWAELSAVIETFAYYNDTETSSENIFSVSTLDFSIPPTLDFSPLVTPTATSSRDISITNDGMLGFQYTVTTTNATGTLCDYLNLTAILDGNNVYDGLLTAFNYNAGEFSTSTDDWQFIAILTSNDPALQNQTCNFNFVFNGVQVSGIGFSDQEEITNIIQSGNWIANYLVINEVYYDVASDKGEEPKNEWIELYNPTNLDIPVKNWTIADNYATTTITANITIPAGGFAVVSKDASTWAPGKGYWTLPPGTIKIILGGEIGNGLDNNADMLILKDDKGNIIDQMNWGMPDSGWPNYNLNLWHPGPAVGEGHSLARIIKGYDTDQSSDWVNLTTPNPGANPHLILGEESFEEELSMEEELLEENLEQEGEQQDAIVESNEMVNGENIAEENIESRDEEIINSETDTPFMGTTTPEEGAETTEEESMAESSEETSLEETTVEDVPGSEENPTIEETQAEENTPTPTSEKESIIEETSIIEEVPTIQGQPSIVSG